MGCGMDRQLVYGMNRVLYGVGRVPLFWPDCLPSAGSCFFLLPKLVFISFGHHDKSCFFFFCGIYTGVLCTCPLLQPMVLKGSNPVRLSAMVCQSLLQTIWRDVQQNVICHRFIPDEHVQAIWKVLFLVGLIYRIYLSCVSNIFVKSTTMFSCWKKSSVQGLMKIN